MAAKKSAGKKAADADAVEAYFEAQPEGARRVLGRVRSIAAKVAPEATPRISYGIVGFDVGGRVAFYLAGWKDHYAVYPATERLRAALGDALTPHLAAKGTLKFAYADAMPTHLLQRIVRELCAEARDLNSAKKKTPAKKKTATSAKTKTAAKKKTAKKTTRP